MEIGIWKNIIFEQKVGQFPGSSRKNFSTDDRSYSQVLLESSLCLIEVWCIQIFKYVKWHAVSLKERPYTSTVLPFRAPKRLAPSERNFSLYLYLMLIANPLGLTVILFTRYWRNLKGNLIWRPNERAFARGWTLRILVGF